MAGLNQSGAVFMSGCMKLDLFAQNRNFAELAADCQPAGPQSGLGNVIFRKVAILGAATPQRFWQNRADFFRANYPGNSVRFELPFPRPY